MDNYPKITVVTPNYNGGDYLEDTIISVLSQNYPNLEYIIIDGGSDDKSISIIKKYESKLTYWISEPDRGLYHALQKGFDISTGDIMAYLNSDDIYHANSLFTIAEIFGLKNVKWLQGLPTLFDEMGRTVSVPSTQRWSNLDYYLGEFKWIQQESTFWSRELWQKAGSRIHDELKYAGDLGLWLRFFRYEKLYVTSALVGGFRMRSKNQLSLDHMDVYLKEANDAIKKEIECNLSSTQKKVIEKLNQKNFKTTQLFHLGIFGRLINKFFLWNYQYTKNKFQDYPPLIYFDRHIQKFVIDK